MKIHNIIYFALATVFVSGNLGCAYNIVHEPTITEYKQECDMFMSESCNKLGDMYYKGVDAERNLNLAKKYHEKACDLYNGDSCNTLGQWYQFPRYYNIVDLKQDPLKAKELFERGCENMNGKSCTSLGKLYLQGDGVRKDNDTADMYFTKACDLYRDGEGCESRAFMFLRGLNGPEDMDTARKYERAAVKLYKAACDKSNGEECQKLSSFYSKKQNKEEALIYSIDACIFNDKRGCYWAGWHNYYTFNKHTYSDVVYYFDKACALYEPEGCSEMANLYYYGRVVPQDKRVAKAYFKLACNIVKKDWIIDYCEIVEQMTDQGY